MVRPKKSADEIERTRQAKYEARLRTLRQSGKTTSRLTMYGVLVEEGIAKDWGVSKIGGYFGLEFCNDFTEQLLKNPNILRYAERLLALEKVRVPTTL